jgi:hypothetical protein
VLTNVYEQQVEAYALPDGRQMLFRASETFPARDAPSTEELRVTGQYIKAWTRELEARGMQTWVLLLPTRYTLYGPWLVPAEERAAVLRAANDFQVLEAELNNQGIRTIDGLEVFRETAAEELASGNLLFYREDNHWAPAGVERIARVLADSLNPLPMHTGPGSSVSTSSMAR